MDVGSIRRGFPALENCTWFQNGGVSITPKCVADEHARLMQELLERGPMHIVYPDEEYPRRHATMRRLASFQLQQTQFLISFEVFNGRWFVRR